MRVLWITNKAYPVSGGAQITNLAFLKNLSRLFGHECCILSYYPYKKSVHYGHVKLRTFRDAHDLKMIVRSLAPDIIISGMDISHHAIRLGRHYDIPTILYLQSYEYSPPTASERKKWGVSQSREYAEGRLAEFIFKEADARVVNSQYMKRRFERDYKANFHVIYPEIIKQDCLIDNDYDSGGRYITGVCGFPHKGADIFYDLARYFKSEQFLLVGNASHAYIRKFEKLDNVRILPFTPLKNILKECKVVVVPSQWPEPFGRIAVEAMANGIPTLASVRGGMAEIVKGTSIGVRRYSDPDAWIGKLDKLLKSQHARELNSLEGITSSQRFLGDRSTHGMNSLIKRLVKKKKPDFKAKKTIALCGHKKENTAFSSINSRWFDLLEKEKNYYALDMISPLEVSSFPVDCFIHHDYQEDFSRVSLPDEGKFIAVRTWDFGRFPVRWIEKISNECDQLWVHSSWVKSNAVKSGIDKKRIKVIPHGIDEKTFKPAGKKYRLDTDKSFKFLFVGATIYRKGIDILLNAYGNAFSSLDDVCLVIKDNPRDVFYKGIKLRDDILGLKDNMHYPEVIYIDKYLSSGELASLYRACDVGVFPYRAEGFCMPILEAMACGLPSIVPDFGACLDLCSNSSSFLIPCRRINLPVSGKFMINTLGFTEEVEEVDFCEVSRDTLAAYLRKAFSMNRKIMEKKSLSGVKKAHDNFKWSDVGALIRSNIERLDISETPLRLRGVRAEQYKSRKKYELAKEMFLSGEKNF